MILSLLVPLDVLCTDVQPAGAEDLKEIWVEIEVPDSAWTLEITSVYQVNKEIWVLASLHRDAGLMGAMVISTLRESVKIPDEDMAVKIFVQGKTWNWGNTEGYTYLENFDELKKKATTGKQLYPRLNRTGTQPK